MDELEKIADAKAHASAHGLAEKLSYDIEALHRQNAAKGMLQSGATIIQSQELCAQALHAQGEAIKVQYAWVLTESIWVTRYLIDSLVGRAREHLQPILDASNVLMKISTDRAGSPNLLARSLAALEDVRDRVWTDIDLALRANVAENRRRAVRSVGKTLGASISKLVSFVKGK